MISRAEVKARAKEQIRGAIGALFVCYFVYFVITMVVVFIFSLIWPSSIFTLPNSYLNSINTVPYAYTYGYADLVVFLIIPPFWLSGTMIFLALVNKGIKPKVQDIFEGFKIYGKAFLLYLLTVIFIFLWMMLLIIPGIIKSLAYMFAPYILAENPDMKPLDAISESKRITQGHKADLFIFGLSFLPWILLGIITFGIAFIWITPYMEAATVNYYNALKNPGGSSSLDPATIVLGKR